MEQLDIRQLIGEATEYDKKQALEVKKPKSWCKSVSAFANGIGGKLVWGIADDDSLVGLADAKGDSEKISEAIDIVKQKNKKVGLSVKPKTPAEALYPYLERLDMVLVMTVEPGFGGQSFMYDQLPKIKQFREEIDRRGLDCELEVDGGVDPMTAKLVKVK